MGWWTRSIRAAVLAGAGATLGVGCGSERAGSNLGRVQAGRADGGSSSSQAACPAGSSCQTIADGPGLVCVAR